MKLFTSLLVFAQKNNIPYIMVDKDKNPPLWQLKDDNRHSLDIVKAGLSNIAGFDQVWFPFIEQSGIHEFFENTHKHIYILYSVYFDTLFQPDNINYEWVRVSDCQNNDKLYNIIRYCITKRV